MPPYVLGLTGAAFLAKSIKVETLVVEIRTKKRFRKNEFKLSRWSAYEQRTKLSLPGCNLSVSQKFVC